MSADGVRGILAAAMRALRFVPLAFLCGVHGFALFAPYVLVMAGLVCLRRARG